MATTTNYGWTTPDDTALVKDGAAAIRTLGSSVDTTTKNLNPETTLGDISYRSSSANVNTRLPLGTAGQVLKVNSGATAPEWATDSSGMTNPMTTTGDTIYSSSDSTPARLGIGTTGQVLTVAGGVPSWATPAGATAGLTKISMTSFSNVAGTGTTFDNVFTSTYDNYMLVMDGMRALTQNEQFQFVLRRAAASLGSNYGNVGIMGSTYSSVTNSDSAKFDFGQGAEASSDSAVFIWYIFRNNNKISWTVQGMRRVSNTGVFGGGFSNSADADAGEADGFQLSAAAGNITGNVTIYGLEK